MTDNKVAKIHEVLEPRTLLEKAIASGAGVDVIERLMDMQERWEATQARKAFNAAIAAFKKSPPAILKNVDVDYTGKTGGRTSYKYEDLSAVLAAVDPALAEHGLWVRFKVKTETHYVGENKTPVNMVIVTCVVGHTDGHSESDNVLGAAPDTSGSKNAVQAIGSTVSYLQRYTLKAALGLAAARDDDGRGGNGKAIAPALGTVISETQANDISALLLANPKISVEKFLELAAAPSISDIMAVKFDSAMQYLNKQVAKQQAKK